MMKPGI